MATTNNNGAVHRRQGGNHLDIYDGGQITNDGTQAAAIADETALTGGESPTEAEFNALLVKFNALLAAVRGVGIIASS